MTLLKREEETRKVVSIAKELLADKKAKNIAIIDLTKLDHAVCDFFIVTHGTSDRHAQGLAENLVQDLKQKHGVIPWHVEGLNNKDWILVDYADFVVHVFREEMREFYNIEELWADAKITYFNED